MEAKLDQATYQMVCGLRLALLK